MAKHIHHISSMHIFRCVCWMDQWTWQNVNEYTCTAWKVESTCSHSSGGVVLRRFYLCTC
jgi:hypothetical protein